MTEIVMPRLSDSMEEGTVLKWLKQVGEPVERGEPLVEIESDKASMTYESDSEGVLEEVVAAEGATLPVGATIARLGATGTGTESHAPSAPLDQPEKQEPQTENRQSPPSKALDKSSETSVVGGVGPITPPSGDGHVEAGAVRVKASPLARRLARERGVDLASVIGTGPGGRVIKADVEQAAQTQAAAPLQTDTPEPTEAPPSADQQATAKGHTEFVELSRAQKTVARKMAESRATVPEFSIRAEIDMERAVDLRQQLKAGPEKDGVVPSLNDFFVKACGWALAEFPRMNGSYRDGRFELYSRVNVGVAVAGTDGVLSVPTVFDADHRSLEEITQETRRLSQRVREGTITPPELAGGTFTVSNLGMYGVRSFNAVINQPQAAILAVGAIERRPTVHEGQLAIRHLAQVELSCDHRIVYGAEAAQFLAEVKQLLETPLLLLPEHG